MKESLILFGMNIKLNRIKHNANSSTQCPFNKEQIKETNNGIKENDVTKTNVR